MGMDQAKLLDAHVQAKQVYNLLGEVLDLSRQLAEAIDRDDQVSVRMVMAMREGPIQGILRAREALRQQEMALPPEEGRRLRALLDGKPAAVPEEEGLAKQVASNIRLLTQVQELDKRLNQKLTRGDSVYR